MQQRLVIVSGPSGAGKSTIVDMLLQSCSHLHRVTCLTTRLPRANEKDGEQFHFVSRGYFERLIKDGLLATYTSTYGDHWYGVEHSALTSASKTKIPILELDYYAIERLGNAYKRVTILIIAPSSAEAYRRIVQRGSHPSAEVKRRLGGSLQFLENAAQYDFVIVNESLEQATLEALGIVQVERLQLVRSERQVIIDRQLQQIRSQYGNSGSLVGSE